TTPSRYRRRELQREPRGRGPEREFRAGGTRLRIRGACRCHESRGAPRRATALSADLSQLNQGRMMRGHSRIRECWSSCSPAVCGGAPAASPPAAPVSSLLGPAWAFWVGRNHLGSLLEIRREGGGVAGVAGALSPQSLPATVWHTPTAPAPLSPRRASPGRQSWAVLGTAPRLQSAASYRGALCPSGSWEAGRQR